MTKDNKATDLSTDQQPISSEEDYKLIEGALLQNPRGRWFLEEYINRNRPDDTQKLLNAIQRIETNLTKKTPQLDEADPFRMSIIEMSKAIAKTRDEIKSIKPKDAQDDQIMNATEELSAIVESTENATNIILEAAEEIQEAAWILREAGADNAPCDSIDEKTTDIYTACSFQDITGQRTTKVVQALCYIENRINAMIDIWEIDVNNGNGPIKDETEQRPDSHLLNGPALHDKGVKQNTVDDILTENADQQGGDSLDIMSFDAIDDFDAVSSSETNDETANLDDINFDAIASEEEEVSSGAIDEFVADGAIENPIHQEMEPAIDRDSSEELDFDLIKSEPSSASDVSSEINEMDKLIESDPQSYEIAAINPMDEANAVCDPMEPQIEESLKASSIEPMNPLDGDPSDDQPFADMSATDIQPDLSEEAPSELNHDSADIEQKIAALSEAMENTENFDGFEENLVSSEETTTEDMSSGENINLQETMTSDEGQASADPNIISAQQIQQNQDVDLEDMTDIEEEVLLS